MATFYQQGNNSSIETIFSDLVVLDIVKREAALKKLNKQQPALVAEVESLLLAAEEAKDFLSYSPVSAFSELEPDEKSWIGLKIGAYQIIRELGRGGMGTVFLAERADGEYQKQVAIKIVNRVVNTKWGLRHFKAERQILASLEHPNIASLLDGGTTEDGYPYLVMEYIQGLPIDSYCQTRHLTIKEKLELFIKVCNAVQYAHQNHIVHRDLKPVNILITEEGIPKLLDFGIAKLLGSEETSWKNNPKMLLDFPMMTPEYASPEQILGDTITILSDIYALGVILYELISGQRPHKFPCNNIANIAQIICDKQIPPPSRRLPELRSQLNLEKSVAHGF
jgi:serine/threonine protein kinase